MTNELSEQTITLKELGAIVQALRATMQEASKDAFRSGVMASLALVGEHATLLCKEKAMQCQLAERTQVHSYSTTAPAITHAELQAVADNLRSRQVPSLDKIADTLEQLALDANIAAKN